MKRALSMLLMIVLLLSFLPMKGFAGDSFLVSITGNYLVPADEGFKEIYGSSVFYPELKLGYKMSKSWLLWFRYGYLSANGTTPVLNREAKTTQHFLSGGPGYMGKISQKLFYTIEAGIFYVKFKEEALDEELSDSAIGFRIDGGLIYRLSQSFFVDMTLGYINASDTIEGLPTPVELGGFKAGIGLGISL